MITGPDGVVIDIQVMLSKLDEAQHLVLFFENQNSSVLPIGAKVQFHDPQFRLHGG